MDTLFVDAPAFPIEYPGDLPTTGAPIFVPALRLSENAGTLIPRTLGVVF